MLALHFAFAIFAVAAFWAGRNRPNIRFIGWLAIAALVVLVLTSISVTTVTS